MAALTGSADLQHKGNLDKYKLSVKCIGADTFYMGALVYADITNGKAQSVPASGGNWADTDKLIGICAKTTVTTAADQMVEIYTGGLWAIPGAVAVVEGDVGDVLVIDADGGVGAMSDNPADGVTGTAATLADGDILIGKILAVDATDATRCWVRLQPGWNYEATGVLGWL
jgi:hypothetical protein